MPKPDEQPPSCLPVAASASRLPGASAGPRTCLALIEIDTRCRVVMGGPGSSRWDGHERRTLVDECRVLSTAMFAAGGWRALSGVRVWGEGDPPAARVSWELLQFGGRLAVALTYHLGNEQISDIVPLELAPTAPHRRK